MRQASKPASSGAMPNNREVVPNNPGRSALPKDVRRAQQVETGPAGPCLRHHGFIAARERHNDRGDRVWALPPFRASPEDRGSPGDLGTPSGGLRSPRRR